MPGDRLDDVRRRAEFQEQAHDGVPEVVQPNGRQGRPVRMPPKCRFKLRGSIGVPTSSGRRARAPARIVGRVHPLLVLPLPVLDE